MYVPHIANAMPIYMVKTALYPTIIQFDEEIMQSMRVTDTTKVLKEMRLLSYALSDSAMLCRIETGQIFSKSSLWSCI